MYRRRSSPRGIVSLYLLTLALSGVADPPAHAASLASSTFDTDSYVFVGTNSPADSGVTISTDYAGGVVDAANVHFNFGLIKFDDLAALETKTNGGPDKFLRLSVAALPGPSVIGVSMASGDVESTYPSFFFPGNPPGDELDRQQWFIDHIKGDDPSFGGYAGGAEHLGVLNVVSQSTYFLDVTSAVDAWIDGSSPNYGFGLWGVDVAGGQGDPFDIASMEHDLFSAGSLVSEIPEPATTTLCMVAIALSCAQARRSHNVARGDRSQHNA